MAKLVLPFPSLLLLLLLLLVLLFFIVSSSPTFVSAPKQPVVLLPSALAFTLSSAVVDGGVWSFDDGGVRSSTLSSWAGVAIVVGLGSGDGVDGIDWADVMLARLLVPSAVATTQDEAAVVVLADGLDMNCRSIGKVLPFASVMLETSTYVDIVVDFAGPSISCKGMGNGRLLSVGSCSPCRRCDSDSERCCRSPLCMLAA